MTRAEIHSSKGHLFYLGFWYERFFPNNSAAILSEAICQFLPKKKKMPPRSHIYRNHGKRETVYVWVYIYISLFMEMLL